MALKISHGMSGKTTPNLPLEQMSQSTAEGMIASVDIGIGNSEAPIPMVWFSSFACHCSLGVGLEFPKSHDLINKQL